MGSSEREGPRRSMDLLRKEQTAGLGLRTAIWHTSTKWHPSQTAYADGGAIMLRTKSAIYVASSRSCAPTEAWKGLHQN